MAPPPVLPAFAEDVAIERLRRRRRRPVHLMLLVGLALPFAYPIGMALAPAGEFIPLLVMVTGIAAAASSIVAAQFAKCPCCRRRFFTASLSTYPFVSRCGHCGLSLNHPFPLHPTIRELLRLWVAHPHPRPPIPDIGLFCRKCGYPLTGLTEERCPECGIEFSIARMISGGEQSSQGRGGRQR